MKISGSHTLALTPERAYEMMQDPEVLARTMPGCESLEKTGEDKRYELDEGELIEMPKPAYKHNRSLIRLTSKVFFYFETNPIGEVLNSENLYALAPVTRRAPDVAIILGDRQRELADAKVIH